MGKYSQNNEQEYILNYFNGVTNGKFIEIGGFNPFTFSNTRALVEVGWSGVYVEPSPSCMESFKKEYVGNAQITLCEYAITTEPMGKMKFYDSQGDAISSLSKDHADKWTKGYKVDYKEIEVETMPMLNFLGHYGDGCNFLNLDVEGINIDLFRAIPSWFLEQIKLICIEHDENVIEIRARLSRHGFKQLHLNGENLIMGK